MKNAAKKACSRCGRLLHQLGYARHMAMHRDHDDRVKRHIEADKQRHMKQRAYTRTCEECGEPHTYCKEDADGLMVCADCQVKFQSSCEVCGAQLCDDSGQCAKHWGENLATP